MKTILFRSLAVLAALTAAGHAQTINWGSEVFSDLRDSNGGIMPETFQFELGAFNAGFIPGPNNLVDWFANWHVFDSAAYSAENGYFTGTAQMLDNGSSSDAPLPPAAAFNGGLNFQNLDAYLWIRNSESMEMWAGNEWLLVRDPSWVFPTAKPGCCDNELPVEWSVSDLSPSDVPSYGFQNSDNAPPGTQGPGDYTSAGGYTLQSYTLLPEPSSAVMVMVIGLTALLDRRRSWRSSGAR